MSSLASILLVLSGAAALTYQVVWARLLVLTLGATTSSVSAVLAAFFLGIALGSALAPRLLRGRSPLRVYAVLELSIAAFGLALLGILPNLEGVVLALPSQHVLWKLLVSMALLLGPTTCMGATFPVLTSATVEGRSGHGATLGRLYAANTGGAVLGALLSGFWFIPSRGLDGAGVIAVALNLACVVVVIASSRWLRPPAAVPLDEDGETSSRRPEDRRLALVVLATTGFVSIATEVGWTRFLILYTGGTLFGLSTILAVFLAGIASGSWIVRSRLEHVKHPRRWMLAGLVALSGSLLFTRELFRSPSGGFSRASVNGPLDHAASLLAHFGVLAVLLLVPTMLFGALFPLSTAIYCGSVAGTHPGPRPSLRGEHRRRGSRDRRWPASGGSPSSERAHCSPGSPSCWCSPRCPGFAGGCPLETSPGVPRRSSSFSWRASGGVFVSTR